VIHLRNDTGNHVIALLIYLLGKKIDEQYFLFEKELKNKPKKKKRRREKVLKGNVG